MFEQIQPIVLISCFCSNC